MRPILQQMYDYHYGEDLQRENVNHRIKELELTARTVLENGCPLTVAELAIAIIDFDPDICPFCEKGEGPDYLESHQESCLFAIAHQVLRPEVEEVSQEPDNGMDAAAQAVEMAQSLGIDNAVRLIAQSGKNHDLGPNWYAEFESMQISATFGAGTNSAGVQALVGGKTTVLYSATEYGGHTSTFRNGPWVQRVLNWAAIVQSNNEAATRKRRAEQKVQTDLKFEEVDF